MPILKLTAQEARRNLRHENGVWPDGRTKTRRLANFATVAPSPSFTFNRSDKIMTIGSCFAREIEKVLLNFGFEVPMARISVPVEERTDDTPNQIVNKYTVHSIVNELRWSLEGCAIPDDKRFLELLPGEWHDPQLSPSQPPVGRQRVAERRRMIEAEFARLPDCRVVIVTLGLAEAWFDSETNLYLNGAPPYPATQRQPDRFQFCVLDYREILDGLEAIHDLIARYGHKEARMLVTVSPVPFKATFTGSDALSANCYSKSVQRAACGEFVRRHNNADYFPSYEIVTLSERSFAFEEDNIHVNPELVQQIMRGVLTYYAPEFASQETAGADAAKRPNKHHFNRAMLLKRANVQLKEGEPHESSLTLAALYHRYGHELEGEELKGWRIRYLRALIESRDKHETPKQLQLLMDMPGVTARDCFDIALRLSLIANSGVALVWFARTIEIDPLSADYRSRFAKELVRDGRHDEARQQLLEAFHLKPGMEHATKVWESSYGAMADTICLLPLTYPSPRSGEGGA